MTQDWDARVGKVPQTSPRWETVRIWSHSLASFPLQVNSLSIQSSYALSLLWVSCWILGGWSWIKKRSFACRNVSTSNDLFHWLMKKIDLFLPFSAEIWTPSGIRNDEQISHEIPAFRPLKVCFTLTLFLGLRKGMDFSSPRQHAWSCCPMSQPCLLQECESHFTMSPLPFPSLQALLPLPAIVTACSACHSEVGCYGQGAGNGGAGGGGHYFQIPAVPVAGGLGCGGSPFLPAWLVMQCPLGNWQPGASCGLWSSSRVASWPALCQSSKCFSANNRGIHSLALQLQRFAGISCIKMSDCNTLRVSCCIFLR